MTMKVSKRTKINILLSIAFLLIIESKFIISHLFYGTQFQTHFNIWFIGTIVIGAFLEYFVLFFLSNTVILMISKNKSSFTYKTLSFLIIFLIIFLKSISTSASKVAFIPNYYLLIISVMSAIILTLIYANNKNSKPLLTSTVYISVTTIIVIILIPLINSLY